MGNELTTRMGRDLWAVPPFGRLFDDWFKTTGASSGTVLRPAMDVEEDADTITVRTELPGIPKEEVQITLEDGVLTITGEKRSDRETKEKDYHVVERSFGSFHRALTLPAGVDGDKAKASFADGVLTIKVPKSEAAKPRHLKID